MSTTEGEADVNDFLMRIKELGNKRDQEDEDRTRKLEEEILQGRKERQARRAERALSISPTKSSPMSTPTRPRSTIISDSDIQGTPELSRRGSVADSTIESLTNSNTMADFKRTSQMRDSPSNAMPSRNSPLAWARRPESSDKPRSRPLSMAALSAAATPTSDTASGEETTFSREQIAQSLASKDPAWFRQTADRGVGSPAYRRNQVEDEERSIHGSVQMPGMLHNNNTIPDKSTGEIKDFGVSPTRSLTTRSPTRPPARNSISFGSGSRASYQSNPGSGTIMGSPVPTTDAQRFDPPSSDSLSEIRGLAMSPSQGRISPDRFDRPVSPTKGMGGFVQSAMMKRSESMNKRWSTQSPSLSRRNSISNRNSYEPNVASLSMENLSLPTSRPPSRPNSSHSNATTAQEPQRPGTANSMKSNMTTSTTNESFRPAALVRSKTGVDPKEETPPVSPSKTMDSRRWSPTKSSWLESALNKPESPKPKATPPPQQPSWMTEISRARQKASVDLGRSQTVKHEVNIGGLMRSPPPGPLLKPSSMRDLPAGFTSSIPPRRNIESMINQDSKTIAGTPNTDESPITSTYAASKPMTSSPASTTKPKPDTPPKKDFRSVLKSRQVPTDEKSKEEPEFKNVFGQLRRTKTQNYVAPDVLRDNITRGKAGLNITGGPKKTEHEDEFKTAILKRKEEFKKAQEEGKGVTRKSSNASRDTVIPEALARRQTIVRHGSISGAITSPPLELRPAQHVASESPTPSLAKETSAPGRLQAKEAVGGKLAGRFNPALADLLARGPPSLASETSRSSSPSLSQRTISMSTSTTNPESTEAGPQLTHMTKGRARGPKRKAPSTVQSSQAAAANTETKTPTLSPVKAFTESQPSLSANTSPKRSSIFELNTEKPQENSPIARSPSPRKLDIRRRSLFLQETPKDTGTTQLEAPKPLSPIKNANFPTEMKTQLNKTEASIVPDLQAELPAPATPSTPFKARSEPIFQEPESPETAKLRPAPLSPRKANSIKIPSQPSSESSISEQSQVFSPKSAQVSDFPSGLRRSKSVKNAAAMWEQSSAENSPRIRSPIKLPTHEDEKLAMAGAGLRPSSPLKANHSIDQRYQAEQRPAFQAASASSRPLPTPPPKNLSSPPVSAGLRSPSLIHSPVPQASEASQLLADFFGDDAKSTPNFATDTTSVLMTKGEQASNIRTIQANLFQLSGDGKKQAVPTHYQRVLFEREMYLCPHTFNDAAGRKVTEVYWWTGDEVPASVVDGAEIFAQREARNLGGRLLKLRQGTESPGFYQALGGIIIIRRGSANKFDSLAPHILCARQQYGMIVFDEVDYSSSTLCSGFPYLISTLSGKTYLWKGRGSTAEELGCARLLGMEISMTGDIEEIEDGYESASFLSVFGNDWSMPDSADHWRLKPNYNKYSARLFCANHTGRQQITEITPFTQSDLSPSNIYILDAFFEIYIVIGGKAQSRYGAFHNALLFAQEYGILAASMEDRPFVPVSTVVVEGIPKDLKSVFRKWSDKLAPTIIQPRSEGLLKRGRSLRVVPLTAALEATMG